jgi:hypothetical protein
VRDGKDLRETEGCREVQRQNLYSMIVIRVHQQANNAVSSSNFADSPLFGSSNFRYNPQIRL